MTIRAHTAAAMLALSASVTTSPALAFKEPGHRAIEAAAYEILLTSDSITCPGNHFTTWNGPGEVPEACIRDSEVIPTLISYGVLNAPGRPFPPPSENFDPDFAHSMVEGLVIQSHLPDHLFDRQLQADRQCFHFNARGEHTTLTDHQVWGVPQGLVKEAYVECIGLVDGLLRGVLYDPRSSAQKATGIYVLMHVIEDSFADSHVARDSAYQILYVKPWNLRTWSRYFFTTTGPRVMRSHFSEEHHMGSDTRDLGYLVGPRDADYDTRQNEGRYRQAMKECLDSAKARLRRPPARSPALEKPPFSFADLEGEMIVPAVCLSERGQRARDAIADLLRLIAFEVRSVKPSPVWGTRVAKVGFPERWLNYRRKYLGHRLGALTESMNITPAGTKPLPDVRDRFLYPSDDLAPRKFRTAGAGLTTELRTGTPLWLGLDLFQSRDAAGHNRTMLLLDSLGWGVQVRLPLENEIGERPVGVAFDIGPGLPLPLTELISIDELQIYVGARLRLAYTAQSVFESETRHELAFGFGGLAADFIVGGQVWFGVDALRSMYTYDFWKGKGRDEPWTWSFSGGIATDAF